MCGGRLKPRWPLSEPRCHMRLTQVVPEKVHFVQMCRMALAEEVLDECSGPSLRPAHHTFASGAQSCCAYL